MSSSLQGRATPGRQFGPYFGPTIEGDAEDATGSPSYELTEGRPKSSRPELVICNPNTSPVSEPGDCNTGGARATGIRGIPTSHPTSPVDADFETDKISGQYDRFADHRLTSFSTSDGGPTGDPSDSNEGGARRFVDNSPWWQSRDAPEPPEPWYRRPIKSFWKEILPGHLQPWWKRNKWIITLLVFLGTTMLIIGILWATGTLTGANLENFYKAGNGENGNSSSNTTSPDPSPSDISPSTTSTHAPSSTGPTTKITKCDDPTSYLPNVSWVGLDDGAGQVVYEPKTSAEDCCAVCALSPGCAAWVYDPLSRYTPCAKIMTSTERKNADSQCPKGYVDSVSANNGGGRTAGTGPCGLGISSA